MILLVDMSDDNSKVGLVKQENLDEKKTQELVLSFSNDLKQIKLLGY